MTVLASGGAGRIVVERARQVFIHHHTPGHDDLWTRGELLDAASAYILAADALATAARWVHEAGGVVDVDDADDEDAVNVRNARDDPFLWYFGPSRCPDVWPFGLVFFKPKATIQDNIVVAGGFLAAEIDRLDRAQGLRGAPDGGV